MLSGCMLEASSRAFVATLCGTRTDLALGRGACRSCRPREPHPLPSTASRLEHNPILPGSLRRHAHYPARSALEGVYGGYQVRYVRPTALWPPNANELAASAECCAESGQPRKAQW